MHVEVVLRGLVVGEHRLVEDGPRPQIRADEDDVAAEVAPRTETVQGGHAPDAVGLGVAHLALWVRVDLDGAHRCVHSTCSSASHHLLGLDGAEAAPVDRAAAGLPLEAPQVDALVVGVLLLHRYARGITRVAGDRSGVRPRPQVHVAAPTDRDRRCSLLHGDVRRSRVHADDGTSRAQHVDDVPRCRRAHGLDPVGHPVVITADGAHVEPPTSELRGQSEPAVAGPALGRSVGVHHEHHRRAQLGSRARRQRSGTS